LTTGSPSLAMALRVAQPLVQALHLRHLDQVLLGPLVTA